MDPDSGLTWVYAYPSGNPARVGIQTQIEKKKSTGSRLGLDPHSGTTRAIISQHITPDGRQHQAGSAAAAAPPQPTQAGSSWQLELPKPAAGT